MYSQISNKAKTIVTDAEGWTIPNEGDIESEMLNNVFTVLWKKTKGWKVCCYRMKVIKF